jgi:hypothetical protein
LSREGCRHFEAFDRGNKDFDAGVFRIEDDVLKRALWGCFMIGCGVLTAAALSERGLTER